MSLIITGLSKTYPNGVRALKDLTLTIGNHMFGLLGPNGAGKSTLMRTVATLQDPDSGTVQLDDLNVLTQKDEVRKVLGYLPQEFGVYPRMSALDMLHHLAMLKGHYKQDREDADGRSSSLANKPLGRPQKVTQHLFRRHEATFRHCSGSSRKPETYHHRGRTDRRFRSR